MKTFNIRVNCIEFRDYKIEANNLKEAKLLAEKEFNCGSVEGEAEVDEI